jgi:hypothetical protein
MVVVEVGGASTLHLPRKGRSGLPSLLGVMGWPSMGHPVMARCRSGGLPWAVLMTTVPESSPKGEAQATESVGDELETPKTDGSAEGRNIVWQTLATGSGNEHQ